jgi:hypothetical protein
MKNWILSFGAAFPATCFFGPDIGIAFASAVVFACLSTAAFAGIMLFFGALKCPHCGCHDLEVTSIAASCNNCKIIFRRNAHDQDPA